jgi:AcrR family transcriptional regulator
VPRKKQRTPELRDRVVLAAVAILDETGVAGLTARNVAEGAATSVPALYELFGDKAGLVRAVFFESEDPRADLLAVVGVVRTFVRENPVLAEVMFSRPFTDFAPVPESLGTTGSVREFIVRRVRRCIDAGGVVGDATDIAHVVLALAQGLVSQETAGWLGSSAASVDRRWSVAFRALLDGLAPPETGP